jgi:hypothetical protein
MIISHFWLPESTHDAGAAEREEFFTLVTNLEPVPLRFVPPRDPEHTIESTILASPRALRGHWELALPALPSSPRVTALAQPQLDRPARVLVSAMRRLVKCTGVPGGNLILHDLAPWSIGAGSVERLIPADKGVGDVATTTPRVGATPKRVAKRTQRRAR